MRQHLRHKTPAEVFKGQRRTMEQLQAADIAFYLRYRCRERKRRADALFQNLLRYFIANKCREDLCATADKVLVEHLINFRQAKLRQIVRKKKSLLFAQSLRDGLRKADLLIMVFQIIEFH
ncbi:Uncharacterised protein [Salmonella enterica subsp. enterica serovar Typhimurium str. DT104]|nr:Uncharacterised protein [Salmonella enterica subsp. enterica serovar Typhimurium str. DT104]CQG23526.1 Uncharacterised protein [Salmonella enterica subsp. enterica serovar Typhimurium str. DT104]